LYESEWIGDTLLLRVSYSTFSSRHQCTSSISFQLSLIYWNLTHRHTVKRADRRDGMVLVVMSKRIQELNICIIVSATYLRIQDSSLSQTIVMLPNQPTLSTGKTTHLSKTIHSPVITNPNHLFTLCSALFGCHGSSEIILSSTVRYYRRWSTLNYVDWNLECS